MIFIVDGRLEPTYHYARLTPEKLYCLKNQIVTFKFEFEFRLL